MHDGCSGTFENGQQVVNKLRNMGFSNQFLPVGLSIKCDECGEEFDMQTFEAVCPNCSMVYGVTPCHAFDIANVQQAGKNY